MKAKKLVGVLGLSVSIPGLIAALAAVPLAAATTGDQSADTSSEIVTEEECTWYLLNAPGALTLEPATVGAEYEGVELDISASVTDFNVHSSGNVNAGDATSHSECTFYGEGNTKRPIVTVSIPDSNFDATYVDPETSEVKNDTNVSFSLSGTNALDLAWASGSCDAKWTQSSLGLHGASGDGTETGTFLTIPIVSNVTDPVPADANGNDRCKEDVTVGLYIPGDQKPDYPGATYTWTGPTVTTALTTSTTDGGA